ncbi:aminopeptidase N [Aquisalimonas asiatica]|uniref:Aminopeptidase N n=1 Tax=Aquisalimonas asiatica TaxID=406100 RepID=A0A1H8QH78_9GAMM|nr:aminopeptidase N [Aquisalimonas asiatica]SEO53590.1 alanyl aminopeptidase. Metallo peptidase. MEROPS family M01 [Aquisalimonas asiatica]
MTSLQPVRLRDYTPPTHLVDALELTFDLGDAYTEVRSRFRVRANVPPGEDPQPLRLHGRHLELQSLHVDGAPVSGDAYLEDPEGLTLLALPAEATIEIVTVIHPQENTALDGLYRSGGLFCTQCEPEGFRRITYFPDRPDVMTTYTVTLIADPEPYPVLLANGNRVDHGERADGRHWATWHDPHPKPTYLFALVAGDLHLHEERYTTRSGRDIQLHLYVEHANAGKTAHAMRSLRKAMAWDEDTYGLEYDLDTYMIVAVDDFNMGAMENKGLNIFNTVCVLADETISTDGDFETVEAVVAHEYFHNWTGNRVTCRDWFQLSLKEGLTVFREQQFCADMGSPAVKRIQDTRLLRSIQFPEDDGPMAHPVRPESYLEISNFYTATVYDKGAEVIRMYHTLLGEDGFRRGMDLYFQRHDGQAVTCEDFLAAMADANHVDLDQFSRWYTQAGTPVVQAGGRYDASTRRYHLQLSQHTPARPGQTHALPLHLPVRLGLLTGDGQPLPLRLPGETGQAPLERVVALRDASMELVFEDIPEAPVPSLLRDFSAPAVLDYAHSEDELLTLLAHDTDPVNRWDAGQRLLLNTLLASVESGQPPELSEPLREAVHHVLSGWRTDPAFVAEVLTLPSEDYIAEQQVVADIDGIHTAREALRNRFGSSFADAWRTIHDQCDPHAPGVNGASARRLRNLALSYLGAAGPQGAELAMRQYHAATHMSDRLAALEVLIEHGGSTADRLVAAFHDQWRHEPLVINKWLRLQATATGRNALERVRALTAHPGFDIRNPNRVRALLGAFSQSNPVGFHRTDGAGYRLLADYVVELNAMNPQMAARLVLPLTRWRRLDPRRAGHMFEQLERIGNTPKLSKDLQEVITKSLAS